MLSDAVAFWKAIEPKIESKVNEMMANAVRQERYEVVTPPDGKLIEVKQPFGKPIKLPYASTVSDANTGDTVIVEWRGTLSTALVTAFGDGKINALTTSYAPEEALPDNFLSVITSTGRLLAKGADEIVAQGTSGIWTYTKYKSGLAIAFGKQTQEFTFSNRWGAYFESNESSTTPYPFPLTEIYSDMINIINNNKSRGYMMEYVNKQPNFASRVYVITTSAEPTPTEITLSRLIIVRYK